MTKSDVRGWLLARPVAAAVACVAFSVAGCGSSVSHPDEDGFKSEGGGGSASVSASSVANSASSSAQSSSQSSTGIGGAPPIPPLVEVPIGTVPIGEAVPVDVPASMLGIFAVAQAPSSQQIVGFEEVRAPDGTLLIDDYTMPDTLGGYYNFGDISVLVPQTDHPQAMPPMAGTWQFLPNNFGDLTEQADVTVWLRQTLDGKFHGGVIDVNVFAVEGVADEEYLVDRVEEAFNGYAGLWLGTVNVITISDQYWEIDDGNFFQALEETAGAPGKPALNVIAVGYLGGSLEGAAGVTPGAPSNPLNHGGHQSGFFWMVLQDLFFDVTILQHEAGHLAGLYHTSEFEPGYGDKLSDTAFCPDVMDQLTSCPDYDNLMFPTGGDGTNELTSMQQQVIQASPLYRGIVEEGGGPALPLDRLNGGRSQRRAHEPENESTAARRAGGVALSAASRSASWRQGLPTSLADVLSGLWCPEVRAAAPPRAARPVLSTSDFYRVLAAAGGDDVGTLFTIAMDPTAPARARVRAFAALGRSSVPDGARAGFASIVRMPSTERGGGGPSTPRSVRVAALKATTRVWPETGRQLAALLSGDGDRFVAQAAVRTLAGR